MEVDGEIRRVQRVTAGLSQRFTTVPAEEVDRIVRECHSEFEGRPIREFVPILVERTARKRLGGFEPLTSQPANRLPDMIVSTKDGESKIRPFRCAFGDGR